MNENHNHDKVLEDAIERLVHGKKASGNELMDTLGATKPKANPAFMVNLEDRLMAEFSSKEREIKMEKRKERPGKFGRWPLTMAAAVFAILLVGGFALFMQQNPGDEASGIVMNPVTAVVAVQELNSGTIIEEHMVEVRTFTPDPDLNQEALFSNEELVIGTMATEHIAVDQPVLASQIRFVHNPTTTSMPMVPVVIAIQDIPEGTEITADRVEVILFPAANAPSGAFISEEDVVGYIAATTIYQEEIILVRKLMDTSPIDEMEMTVAAISLTATAQAIPYVPLVIAIQDIPEGAEITSEMIETIMFPAANAPAGAFVEEADIVGQYARTTIYSEEIILLRKIGAQACPETSSEVSLYTVRTGDTLYSIAEANNVQVSELIAINCLEGVSGVSMGQVIRIPSEVVSLTATASADTGETVQIIPNVPEPLGCHNDNARLLYPLNGQVIDRPVAVRAIASHDEFAQSRIEISGPSTNEQFVVIASISQQAIVETEFGQFVPASYEDGEYQLRLNTFSAINSQVGTCTITIYISNQASQTSRQTIGILVGHQGVVGDTGAVCENGLTELEVNQDIANRLQSSLRANGYEVVMLDESNPNAVIADLTLRLHTGDCRIAESGYSILIPDADYTENLNRCLSTHYTANTGLRELLPIVGDNPIVGPSLLIEMASLAADQELLTTGAGQITQGLVDTIDCYFGNDAAHPQENLRPVVIAVRDIPMNTVITADMVMLSYWADEIAMQFAMENNGEWYLDNLEGVVGKRSMDFIPAFEPISSNLLIRDSGCNPPCAILPSNRVAIALRNSDESIQNLIIGQSVDVIASFNYQALGNGTFEVTSDNTELTMQRVISDAQVVWIGGNSPDFWNVDPDAVLLADERLVVVAVTAAEATTLQWITEAGLPLMVVPAIEGAEAVEIQQSSNEIQPENNDMINMMVWMDASALSYSVGQHVDVLGQFIYIGADGQFEGMITHRIGVNWIVADVEAGEDEMAAYALVSLNIDESSLAVGQMIPGVQSILQNNTRVLASWSLVPYNAELGESIQYFSYSNIADPLPIDASSVSDGHYYVALPNLEVNSLAGGLTVGDTLDVMLEDGQIIEAQLSYIGSSIYAPFAMQPALDAYRTENPRVMVLEVSSAEEVNTISNYVGNSQPITLRTRR